MKVDKELRELEGKFIIGTRKLGKMQIKLLENLEIAKKEIKKLEIEIIKMKEIKQEIINALTKTSYKTG